MLCPTSCSWDIPCPSCLTVFAHAIPSFWDTFPLGPFGKLLLIHQNPTQISPSPSPSLTVPPHSLPVFLIPFSLPQIYIHIYLTEREGMCMHTRASGGEVQSERIFLSLFLRQRQCEQGRGSERRRQRILRGLCTDSIKSDVGLELRICLIM